MSLTRLWSYPLKDDSIKFFVSCVCPFVAFGFLPHRLSMAVTGGEGVGAVKGERAQIHGDEK